MAERRYTVREIEKLRILIEDRILYGLYHPHRHPERHKLYSAPYSEPGHTLRVEARLRTHMEAGHGPEDFESLA